MVIFLRTCLRLKCNISFISSTQLGQWCKVHCSPLNAPAILACANRCIKRAMMYWGIKRTEVNGPQVAWIEPPYFLTQSRNHFCWHHFDQVPVEWAALPRNVAHAQWLGGRVSREWVIFEYSDFTYSFSFISKYQTNMNMVNLLNTIDTIDTLLTSQSNNIRMRNQ